MVQSSVFRSLDMLVCDRPVDRPCLWFDMVRTENHTRTHTLAAF
jgi:hypothetical protein